SRVGSADRAWCTASSVGTPPAVLCPLDDLRLVEDRRDLRLVELQPVVCRAVAVRGHPLHDVDALVAVVDRLRHRDDGGWYADKNVAYLLHAFTSSSTRQTADPAGRRLRPKNRRSSARASRS